jgi:Cu-processing system permease protein
MNVLRQILAFQTRDALRSRWLLLNGLLYLVLCEGLILAGGMPDRVLVSLINVVLLLVPLVCLVFGTIHFYNVRDYTLLLLTQPIRRRSLFMGLYFGLAAPLSASFALGVGLPFLWHGYAATVDVAGLATVVGLGIVLTFVFVALANLVATLSRHRVQGVGTALLLWLATAIAYDGLVLLVVEMFARFPMERPLLAMMMLNPVDLARVLLLMTFDAGALMGYTGAVFTRFFSSAEGIAIVAFALALWTTLPLLAAGRAFDRTDF